MVKFVKIANVIKMPMPAVIFAVKQVLLRQYCKPVLLFMGAVMGIAIARLIRIAKKTKFAKAAAVLYRNMVMDAPPAVIALMEIV